MAKHQATKAVVRQRTEEILAIRLAGAEFWDAREFVRKQETEPGTPWTLTEGQKPLSDPQLWRYLKRADALAAESTRSTRPKRIRQHIAKRRYLYAKAVAAGDYGKALAILDSEAKLLGLFAPEKTEVTGKGGQPILSLDAIVAAIVRAEEGGSDEANAIDAGTGTGVAPPDDGSEALP
jgi:hypothetical protein